MVPVIESPTNVPVVMLPSRDRRHSGFRRHAEQFRKYLATAHYLSVTDRPSFGAFDIEATVP